MDESYFTEASMLRRLHRENVLALAGPRALLMQAALPPAFEALFAHSTGLEAPYERLERTAKVMNTIGFGAKADADRMTRRVRAMHRRAGVDRPDWLLWVLATLVESALVVYERYVGRLERDERDAYWRDYQVVGRLFGLRDTDMPRSIEDFEDYMSSMLGGDVLSVTPEARELAVQIVMHPPVPLKMRPVVELSNFVTVGLLPPSIRAGYGFGWDPVRGLALLGGAEYARRVLVPLLPGRLRYAA
jgi:uncharacterized protein (DUF2236 family)